jgi:hypothetical protein
MFHDRQDVVMIDCDELKPNSLHKLWRSVGGTESELSQPHLEERSGHLCRAEAARLTRVVAAENPRARGHRNRLQCA